MLELMFSTQKKSAMLHRYLSIRIRYNIFDDYRLRGHRAEGRKKRGRRKTRVGRRNCGISP